MTRPLLLLDVDGVLNPFGDQVCPPGFTEHQLFLDDAHTPEAQRWSETRLGPSILIATHPAVGLTRQCVDEALAWAGNLDSSAGV